MPLHNISGRRILVITESLGYGEPPHSNGAPLDSIRLELASTDQFGSTPKPITRD